MEWAVFKAHVDEPHSHREVQCQPYLVHAAELLLPTAPKRIINQTEVRNFFGRADVVIAADMPDDTGHISRHAYIFELKSPQSHLFETATNERCQPTKEFAAAENQLLHYYHEAAGNARFRERVEVLDQDNIHIGGIVIGTQGRLLRGGGNIPAARAALRVREKYLYHAKRFRIFTWDRILDFVRPD
jgi:hypothetical protein